MSGENAKRHAAEAALAEVHDGMVVGLGTGSTAAIFVEALIARMRRENLKLTAIATSEKTAAQAQAGGIELSDFSRHQRIDVTFDGADAVDLASFAMLKGLGGALLREKIVAQASDRLVIMIDPSKIPAAFGGILPVEIVRFGFEATLGRLAGIAPAALRKAAGGDQAFLTDNGNYIADLTLPRIESPISLQQAVKGIAGVVETGLFIGMADMFVAGNETGAETYRRKIA